MAASLSPNAQAWQYPQGGAAIQREHGTKDRSQLIEGHDGLLDRLHSMAIAAPVLPQSVR